MSFAAEMRDFIAGWTAVNEMGNKKRQLDLQKQEIENLKAYREATLDLDREQLELSRANSARSAALAAERNAIAREESEARKAAIVLEGITGDGTESSDMTMDEFRGDDGGDGGMGEALPLYTGEFPDQTIPRGEYSRGGLVALAADGGMIYDEMGNATGMMTDEPAAEEAIPAAPRPAAQETPRPARAAGPATPPAKPAAQEPDPAAVAKVAEGAQAAVASAAPELIADAKKPDAAIGPDAETEKMDIVNNRGGMSVEEYKELVATIDPNGTIPAYMESAAVLSSTYKYFMEKGDLKSAQKVAKGILVLNKQMTQTLGALAVNALEEGNMDIATRLLSDAANKFPTGQKFQVVPTENGIAFQVMENGEVAQQGELSTDQFWQLAGKVKDGSLYIEEMGRLAAAGEGPRRIRPEEALDLTASAYAEAMQAKEALAVAEQEGASEEDLKALRTDARTAKATYDRYFNNAMRMGLKRTDIEARGEQMFEMAIPDEAEAEAAAAEEGGSGWFSWLANRANPVTALASDAQTVYGAIQNSGAMQPGANAAALEGVTPPGNANLRQPSEADLANARAAIAAGADPKAVARRFLENGFSIEGL